MRKLLFVLFFLVAILLTACGSSAESSAVADLPTAEFEIVATDIAYDTNQLEVMTGQPIKVTFRNEGALEHDFSIMKLPLSGEVMSTQMEGEMAGHDDDMHNMAEEPEVHVAARMNGGSNVLQFTPAEPGTYEYYCTVAGHKEAGMVGALTVQAP